MPTYSHQCAACGQFTEMRSMARAGDPAGCPVCGERSERILTAPGILCMNPALRRAHERNESSAHEPKVVRRRIG